MSSHPAQSAQDPRFDASGNEAAFGRSEARAQDPLEERWTAMQATVRALVQNRQFETWFRRAALVHADDEVVRIALLDNFSRGWLDTYYRDVLERAALEIFGSPRRVQFLVDPEAVARQALRGPEADAPPSSPGSSGVVSAGNPARSPDGDAGIDEATRQGLLLSSDLGLNPKYTFDNFVVGPCNRFAWAAAAGTAEAPGKAYNPFFLHGSVGLGKTHLLQSLCVSILERNAKSRILYRSCETFVNHFISALEDGDLQKFRHKYRNVDVLVVDDIHLLANKERTQEEFFHTFNALHQQGKQIVLSSDSPPRDIPTLQERLVSRFKWGLVTEIEPPCYETRMAILKRKSRDRGREIPDDVARLLAERVDSNIRELEGAVTKLLSYAGLSGRPVSAELAREALRELFAARKGQPAMEDILRVVTEHFGVKLSELQSKRRTNTIAFPRQVAMHLARQITRHSLEEIGGFFGGRDHSTVIYGVEKIHRRAQSDPEVSALLDELLAKLKASSGE
ncbi:MAG: chromosomal replication initiator protein DnaA [Planctomycetota bacterium]